MNCRSVCSAVRARSPLAAAAIAAMVSAVLGPAILRAQDGTSTAVQVGSSSRPTDGSATLMERLVSLHLERVTLRKALEAVAGQAHLRLIYDWQQVPVDKIVSLVADKVTVRDALHILLQDTGVEPFLLASGQLRLRPAGREETHVTAVQQGTANITGYVRDSATGAGLSQAAVRIDGTTFQTKSGANGQYKITGVAAGDYRVTVRRVGYRVSTHTITLSDDQSKTLDFDLSPPPTKLTEVVTTAVGDQRRYQVGNVISTINVDSIAPTAPVTSVTDLISARAPGVSVMEASGLVGSGEAIRIRGVSSVELQSDPMIIVDGVWQNNTPGGYSGATVYNSFGTHETPSRINDLDFADIATIDVLKGPTATTEYGTQAANGVIVITTKHGSSGTPIWHADATENASGVPVIGPLKYYSWGHLANGNGTPTACTLTNPYSQYFYQPSSTGGNCVVDSVTEFNPLQHAATSLYHAGGAQSYNLSVAGGADAVRYFVSGGLSTSAGALQMPPVFR